MLYKDSRSCFGSNRIAVPSRGTSHNAAPCGTLDLNLKPSPNNPPPAYANLQNLRKMLRGAEGSSKFNRKFNEIYWTPQQRNLGAADPLATCIDKHGQPRATFFWLTTTKTHPLGGKPLLMVWRLLWPSCCSREAAQGLQ